MTLAQNMLEDSALQAQAAASTPSPPIKATDLITLFRQARDEQWGYIWGKSGQVWRWSK